MWGKIVLFLIIGAAFLLWPIKNHQIVYATTKPIVFFLAHQDDEMFLAGAIRRAVENQIPVKVVLVTDGGSSTMRYVLNGVDEHNHKVFCIIHGIRHNPKKEGYAPFTPENLTIARNREFFESITSLGVPSNQIFFANAAEKNGNKKPTYHDGNLTVTMATKMIQKYYYLFGDGTYSTLIAKPPRYKQHHDHRALSVALYNFTPIQDKIFFSEDPSYGAPIPLTASEQKAKQTALRSYYEWKPQKGHFAIGEHSVKKMLDFWSNKQFEYEVKQ